MLLLTEFLNNSSSQGHETSCVTDKWANKDQQSEPLHDRSIKNIMIINICNFSWIQNTMCYEKYFVFYNSSQ